MRQARPPRDEYRVELDEDGYVTDISGPKPTLDEARARMARYRARVPDAGPMRIVRHRLEFDVVAVELREDVPPGANAEDCPHCDPGSLPYPWVCPGHTAPRP